MNKNSDEESQRQLQRDHDEIERHLKEGRERIVGSYNDDYEIGKDAGENEIHVDRVRRLIEEHDDYSPHQSIIKTAVWFFEKALDQHEQRDFITMVAKDNFKRKLYYIYISIGTEHLLNGIILKEKHEFFEEETNLIWRSLGFGKILEKGALCDEVRDELLSEELNKKQQNLIDDTLALIKLHRNNLVHLGYHTATLGNRGVFHHVIGYLVAEFTDQDQVAQRFDQHADLEYLDDEDYSPLPFK